MLNIVSFYDLKVAIFEDFKRGNLDRDAAIEKLTKLNADAKAAGLPISAEAEAEIDLVRSSDASARQSDEDFIEDEDSSYDDDYESSYDED